MSGPILRNCEVDDTICVFKIVAFKITCDVTFTKILQFSDLRAKVVDLKVEWDSF